jgi:hypothetical protein
MGDAVRDERSAADLVEAARVSAMDAEFEARLDHWLSYYRIAMAAAGLLFGVVAAPSAPSS